MHLSYWELKSWLSNIDFTIIGSGIVGLSCAIHLKHQFPKAKILVLEKGMLPQGASTKNAGFACFGSLSEIVSDLKNHSEEDVFNLVEKRVNGLKLLRSILGDRAIDYQRNGGYELFLKTQKDCFDECQEKLDKVNRLLNPLFNDDTFRFEKNHYGFKNIMEELCLTPFEGQIDTGKMMMCLLKKAQSLDILVLNNCTVEAFSEDIDSVKIKTKHFELSSKKLFIATNGFAAKLLNQHVEPARAQVLITKPIKNLKIKGTFHLDEGFYYFRNIDNRILLGGGRNLDFKTEETMEFGLTDKVQNKLLELLETTILPNTPFEIEHRWSGIMGVGNSKNPIVNQISDHVYCGIRLGGMGIAIGSLIGKELADLAYE